MCEIYTFDGLFDKDGNPIKIIPVKTILTEINH